MIKKSILIVGSGPSSYAFLKALNFNEQIKITMIDNSDISFEDETDCAFDSKFSGSRMPDEKKVNNNDILISREFGGFSNYWGGTFDNPSETIIEKFSNCGINILKYLDLIENFIPTIKYSPGYNSKNSKNLRVENSLFKIKTLESFSQNGFKTIDSKIAINESAFQNSEKEPKICKFCSGYEWACKPSTIWNSKNFFLDLINSNKLNYEKETQLFSFKETENYVECILIKDDKKIIRKFDKLILASGPASTSKIFLQSEIFKKIILNSSDLIQVPFIKTFKTQKKRHSFADLFLYFQHQNTDVSTYQQIYLFSKSVLLLSSNTIKLNNLLKIIPSFFMSIAGGTFIYLDSDISSKIAYYIQNNDVKTELISSDSKMKKVFLKEIQIKLRKSGIFLLNFLRNDFLHGKSYHLGSQFPLDNKRSDISSDRLGRVAGLSNVHIIDSSTLPKVNTGPVTKLIMANSFRISDELFN